MEIRKVPSGLIPLFLFFVCIISVRFLINLNDDSVPSMYAITFKEEENAQIGPKHDKWIVITTVSEVSDDIKSMTELTDWHIVLVADKKTPKNLTCNNCTFLSVEDQLKLKYKVLPLVPFKSYARKIVGYLYAIEHGAKFIYDTDDDNRPIKSKLDSFDYTNITTGLMVDFNSSTSAKLLNAYSHFGRPDIWPRGFPLQLISDPYSKDYGFKICDPIKTPVIQQGLVNGDPDVDAVYRMIFAKNKTRGLDVTFDPFAAPFVLPPGAYGPFNSQNTLFHYDAFWALLLPVNVTSRVTDIWRGYWAERLLGLTGNYLGYYGANARQYRNPHHYFDDFLQESQLYNQSLSLVETIHNWTCKSKTFSKCLIEMTRLMSAKGFLSDVDVRLAEKWVEDLLRFGYKFPRMEIATDESVCHEASFPAKNLELIKPENVRTDSLKTIYKFCNKFFSNLSTTSLDLDVSIKAGFKHTKSVILIITFNHPYFNNIQFLQTLYEPWFAKVIFCGTFPPGLKGLNFGNPPFDRLYSRPPKFAYVAIDDGEMHKGYFHYVCMHHVIDMQISDDADGYLLISDDVLLNFWTPYDLRKVHLHNDCIMATAPWWDGEFGEKAIIQLQAKLNATILGAENSTDLLKSGIKLDTLVELNNILMIPMRCAADIFYVPKSLKNDFRILSKFFYENRVFLEIGIPKILAVLGWMKTYKKVTQGVREVDFPGKYLWADLANEPLKYFDPKSVFIHAIKMSTFSQEKPRKFFCDNYVVALYDNVNIL